MSAIIGPFPSTLVNGTVEDANQVQTLLTWIQSQVNSNATGGVGTSARNLIYNGAMQIAQRIGTGGNIVVAGGTKAYTLDRWQVAPGAASSATVTQLTSTGLPQFQNALRLQRTASNASTNAIFLAQSMESVDSYPLQGQTVNVSFMARAGSNYSPTGNAFVATLFTGTGTDENVLISYTGGVNAITQTFNITNNWLPYTMSGVLASNMTEFGLMFTMNPTGTAGANDYVDLAAVQIELGPSASTFDVRPFSETIERCQRYYQKSFQIGTKPSTNDTGNCAIFEDMVVKSGTANYFRSFILAVSMRDILVVGVIYNPQAANNQIRDTAGFDFSGCSLSAQGLGATAIGTGNSSSVVGDQLWFNWSLDGEL